MWTVLKTAISKYLTYIKLAAAIAIVFIACLLTYKMTDSKWQTKWDNEQIQLQAATLKQTNENRQKEQDYQNEINRISSEGETKLAAARHDAEEANSAADAASAAVERLRQQINSAITASNRTSDSGASATGKTASQAVNLLANVLGKSIQRNKDLAAFGDDAWERGMTCQASYEALLKVQAGNQK